MWVNSSGDYSLAVGTAATLKMNVSVGTGVSDGENPSGVKYTSLPLLCSTVNSTALSTD